MMVSMPFGISDEFGAVEGKVEWKYHWGGPEIRRGPSTRPS